MVPQKVPKADKLINMYSVKYWNNQYGIETKQIMAEQRRN